jgi:hypothetical protein
VWAFKIREYLFVMTMSDTGFLVIGKVLSADLDSEGNLHITLRNSNQFWAEIAAKHMRQLKGQIITVDIKAWQPSQTTTDP